MQGRVLTQFSLQCITLRKPRLCVNQGFGKVSGYSECRAEPRMAQDDQAAVKRFNNMYGLYFYNILSKTFVEHCN